MSRRSALAAALLAASAAGCNPTANMDTQPRLKPLSPSDFFDDGRSARPLPEGTVPYGERPLDPAFSTGMRDGRELDQLPVPLTRALLERGRERYEIYCSVCHDRVGTGDGMIPRRGFPHPPSYHIARLRRAPLGHFVNIMANGWGMMYSYADRVDARDRWAIAAYIRALQLSQDARLSDVPADQRARLEAAP